MLDPFLQALTTTGYIPAAVKELHSRTGRYEGRCVIERGGGPIASILLWVGRFPPSTNGTSVHLTISSNGDVWTWVRNFGGHLTRSRLKYDQNSGCVIEQIGGLSIWLHPVQHDAELCIEIKRIRVFGVPCPCFLVPKSNWIEWQDERGCFCFDISAVVPVLGRLIRYHGHLNFRGQNTGEE